MRRTSLVILCMGLFFNLFAQQKENGFIPKIQHELGATLSAAAKVGLTYKIGTKEGMFRLHVLQGGAGRSESIVDTTYDSVNKGVAIDALFGYEFRKTIGKKLEIRYGLDLYLGHSTMNREITKPMVETILNEKMRSIGGNLVLGFNYLFNDNLFFGVEILPGGTYFKTQSLISDSNGNERMSTREDLYVGMTNQFAYVTLGVRF